MGVHFIQKEEGRGEDHGPCDGKELEFALGEETFVEGSIEFLGKVHACFVEADHLEGGGDFVHGDPVIAQGELVFYRAFHHGEGLAHDAENFSPFFRRQGIGVPAEDGDGARIRRVEAGNEFEEGALAAAGAIVHIR